MSLHALAAALLADDGTEPWTAGVGDRLEAAVAAMPAHARLGLRAAAAAADGYALARTGRRLGALTAGERETVLAPLAARPGLTALLDMVKMPVILAGGTERMLHHGPGPAGTAPARRRGTPAGLHPAAHWPPAAPPTPS
ncbi:hypothetical protein [Streptomyces sp. MNU89]|uniref:hypothetical protein n=1 Tax=Streptomyces sp. MNU89 TaxID=2560025 RepID=UPI001E3E62B9|nr:hypothetical protein [Streptomyces sp. MNU89]MCC9743081.1 hypothetical protein [Streptomyces sp. MNU89]